MGNTAGGRPAAIQGDREFRILGPLEVSYLGRAVPLGGAQQRALLAILLINANNVVSADRLIELIWGGTAPRTAENILQVYVSQFRKLLEPQHLRGSPYQVLVSRPPGYVLRVEAGELDLNRFEALAQEGRLAMGRRDPVSAAGSLRDALALWRGPALADVADEPFATAEVARLTEMRLQAVEERIEADLALGRHADVIGELQALVAEHPFRERLCGQLMLALYHSGRQAEASDLYQRTRQMLVDQLGMEPGPMLQRLLRLILNQDPALDVAPRPLEVESARSNLPASMTPFVAREREIAEVKDLLAASRLVTLSGAGGIGKTRLAIEVARAVVDEYGEGVWLVDLAPVAEQDQVREAVMYALGLRIHGGDPGIEILIGYLKGRRHLLILDNCDHVIEGAAGLAADLIRSCPDLRILSTSRELLGVAGEVTFRVPALSTPDPGRPLPPQVLLEFEALSLFCECATRALGAFALTDANAMGVAGICHRLDGIPLAIELAASRLKLLSVAELHERLSDGFNVLAGGSRTSVTRHQTLQATIAWSYDLLGPSERALFNSMSVFAGGFTVPAAEAVFGASRPDRDVFDLVARLVDKSLVLPADTVRGRSRLHLLEVLRQFGHERLLESDEAVAVQERHAEYFAALAEAWSPRLRGPEQGAALDRFEVEHDNLRSALAWSLLSGRGDLALRLVAALWLFWYVRGYGAEGLRRATEVLARFDVANPSRVEALFGTAKLAWQQGDLPAAERLALEAGALSERGQDSSGSGLALLCLGNVASSEDNQAKAERLYKRALILLRGSGNHWGASIVLNNLGVMAGESRHYADAERYLSESLELGLRISDPWRKGMALGSLGELFVERGMTGRAAEVLTQCLVIQGDTHNMFSLPNDLETGARLAVAIAQPECALQLAGAATSIRGRFASRSQLEPGTQKAVDKARRELDSEAADGAWRQGLAMNTDEAIDYALGWLRGVTAGTGKTQSAEVVLRPSS